MGSGGRGALRRGDLSNSITVFIHGDEAFVGVSRSARSKDGASTMDLANLHEFGGQPVIIPMTPKVRRFLFVLLRQAGKESTGGSGRGVVVHRQAASVAHARGAPLW